MTIKLTTPPSILLPRPPRPWSPEAQERYNEDLALAISRFARSVHADLIQMKEELEA